MNNESTMVDPTTTTMRLSPTKKLLSSGETAPDREATPPSFCDSDPLKSSPPLARGSATPPESPPSLRKEKFTPDPATYSGILFFKFPERPVDELYPHHYHSEPLLSSRTGSLTLLPISEDGVSEFTAGHRSHSSHHIDRLSTCSNLHTGSPRFPRRRSDTIPQLGGAVSNVVERGNISSLPRGETRPRTFSAPEKSLNVMFAKPLPHLYRRIHPSTFTQPPAAIPRTKDLEDNS